MDELIKNWKYYCAKEPIGDLKITNGQFMTGNFAGILLENKTVNETFNSIYNANSFEYPVRYKIISGINYTNYAEYQEQITEYLKQLEQEGCRYIITSGGIFALLKRHISENTRLLNLCSPLEILPFLELTINVEKLIAIIHDVSDEEEIQNLESLKISKSIISRCVFFNNHTDLYDKVKSNKIEIGAIIWDSAESNFDFRAKCNLPIYDIINISDLLANITGQKPYEGFI